MRGIAVVAVCLVGLVGSVAPPAAASPPQPWQDPIEGAPLPPGLAQAPLPTLHAVAAAPPAAAANSVSPFGDAPTVSTGSAPAVGSLDAIAVTPDGHGYWLLGGDGGVFAYGDAPFLGSIAEMHLGSPAVAIAATPDGGGYWVTTADGRVFSFGDAKFAGAIQNLPVQIAAMHATADGGGYWLASTDGRVFTFGDAKFAGALANLPVQIAAMTTTPDGAGYWLAAADGRVFSFGDAGFAGAVQNQPVLVTGMARTKDGGGYWLLTNDGTVLTFGDAAAQPKVAGSAVAIAPTPTGGGYWVVYGTPTTSAPFNPDVLAWLATRSDTVTAALFDETTGRTFLFAPGVHKHTASVAKVDIMATLFSEVEAAGRPLTSTEISLLHPMIQMSNNAAASALWNEVGAGPAVARFNTHVPMPATIPGPDGLWGLTFTTALDQINLLKLLDMPNQVLSDAYRSLGLSLMESVIPEQRWGVSGGVPSGVTIALKNGWSPLSGHGWITNSIGVVSGMGRHYLLAVLTEDGPSLQYGIDTIQGVAARVWANPEGG